MRKIHVDKYGIEFYYKGDSVVYVWPWFSDRRQKFNNRFYSTSFMCYFKNLKEIDEMWKGYDEAMLEEPVKEDSDYSSWDDDPGYW